jgi:ABC-type microcin C transport system permease subunit YejE
MKFFTFNLTFDEPKRENEYIRAHINIPNTTGALKSEATNPVRGTAFVLKGPVPPTCDFFCGPDENARKKDHSARVSFGTRVAVFDV